MPLKIEHRLGVQAPASVVWEQLVDLEKWGEWNPLYPRAKGVLRIGEPLELDLALAGRPTTTIRPRVIDWVPDEQILWRLSLYGGLVQTTRYIEIEALSEAGCIFSNGEIFSGPLGPIGAGRLRKEIRAGFLAMGEAVKTRAEAAWRARSGAPT
ncbi:MAG TPA: SRPBCC domain-containing protein [Caulobacteraceae bacterium]|nr:SRPBCC domain-containing protein [Caulobacteraceae bacterium]